MKLNNITSKVLSKADLIGTLAGVGFGTDRGLEVVNDIINQVMTGNVHFPDISSLIQNWTQSPFFKNGVYGTVLGWVLDALDFMGTGKYGKALQKASIGYLKGGGAVWLAYYATHANKGSDPSKSNFNPLWSEGFLTNGSKSTPVIDLTLKGSVFE